MFNGIVKPLSMLLVMCWHSFVNAAIVYDELASGDLPSLNAEMLGWVCVLCLFVLGFALVILDIFVTPGFDVVGVFGFLCIFGGIAKCLCRIG